MNLLAVEIRRLAARSMVIAVALIGAGAVGLALLGAWQSAQPLTDAERRAAEEQYELALRDWEENGEQYVADCLEAQEIESEASGQPQDFGCADMAPREEYYVPQSFELADRYEDLIWQSSYLVLFVAFVIGATATAAEVSAGSLSTWLTFVPQRLRVMTSKLAATALVTVPVAAGLTAFLVAGLWVVHAAVGALGDVGAVWGDVAWMSVRVVVLASVMAAVASALGLLLRHTAAVLGVALGWMIVVEAMLASQVQALQPWLLRLGIDGWVLAGTTYWRNECTVTAQGTSCQGTEVAVPMWQSSLVLAVASVVVIGVTALVFRRRDVA